MLHYSATHNRKDVRAFMQDICQSNASERGSFTISNAFEDPGDCFVALGGGHELPSRVILLSFVEQGFRLEPTLIQCAIWANAHSFVAAHGNDISFEISHCCTPHSLVDGELAQSIISGVLV